MTSRLTSMEIPRLIEAAFANLKAHRDEINRLNVFPVPDGDTGTNMVLTMQVVCEEISKTDKTSISALMHALSYGSLMGARGNSGVILSQIIRGMSEVLSKCETITVSDLIEALENSVKVAYHAVRKPVEGTMLTVIKDMATQAKALKGQDIEIENFLEIVFMEGRASLERTPDLLPVLKEAGVVDAGALGLVVLGEGILAALKGITLEEMVTLGKAPSYVEEEVSLKYTYCTEFLLKSEGVNLTNIEEYLEPLGDSIMVVGTPQLTRVHVHTNEPGNVLNYVTSLGTISQVQINNMVEQSIERARTLAQAAKEEKISLVAVSVGEGINDILKSLGVSQIVNGGQTMNPSTSEILHAVEKASSLNVIILPNNKNVILTAEKAKEASQKNIEVVPTKSIPEAFAALLAFNPEKKLEENVEEMTEALKNVKTGEITRAVRETKSKIGLIGEGDYIGLLNHDLKIKASNLIEASQNLLSLMVSKNTVNLVTLIKGEGVTEEDIEKLTRFLKENFSDVEIEICEGKQLFYPLIISAE